MSKIKKKQLGGFGIDPSLGGLLNGIDLNNIDFAQIANLGSQIGGNPFNQAVSLDDPSIYTNSIVGGASRDYATANNPLRTPDEIEEEAKRRTFLGIGKRRAKRKLAQENEDREILNTNTAGGNAQDSFDQFNSFASLFDFIGSFEKGGKLRKMQSGGKSRPFLPNKKQSNIERAVEGTKTLDIYRKQPPGIPDIASEKEFFINYMNSPEYLKRLSKFHDDPEAERKRRIDNINNISPLTLEDRHDLINEGLNRNLPQGAYLWDSHSLYVNPLNNNTAIKTHEVSHASVRGNDSLSKKEKDFIKSNTVFSDNYNEAFNSYLTDPSEYHARLNVLRKWAEDSGRGGIENITPKDLDKVILTEEMPPEVYEQIEQLINTTKGSTLDKKIKTISKVWNTLANASGKEKVQTAELGGKAKLGYADSSPYKNEPSIVIPSGNIDMSKTSMPILAIPNKGTPKIMQPKSGTHIFPDAQSVLEIPIMKWGGKKKKKKVPYYQEGGQPVPAGVQLEDDEIIVTPNMDIMETSARDTHEQMKSDVVTDIIRPEDYVLSNKLKISRKEAEKMSLGFGAMLYREGKIPDMPMEHTIADLFKEGEKSMTLAEYGKRVRKKLPVTDKEDPFSQKTNAANRAARLPYLAAAVYKNEMKRTKGKPEAMFESSFENPFDTSFSSYAGMKEEGVVNMALPGEVQQMQGGGSLNPLDFVAPVMGLTNFVAGVADSLFLAPKRAKIVRKALEEDRTAINQLAGTQGAFSAAATGAALAGYAGQDPTVQAPQYDSTQLEARVKRVPKTLFDYASGRAMAGSRSFQESVFRNAGSFGQAVNAYSPVHAQNIGLLSNLGMQEVSQNINLENQYRDRKQAFDDRQVQGDTAARNATRTNSNALTAGVAGTISGGISTQGSIEANRLNALRQNKLQQTQATLDASKTQQSGINNAFTSLGYAAATLPPDMFNQPKPVNNNLPYIAPPQPYTAPTQLQPPVLGQINPLPPINPYGTGVPINQQGSSVPLGPNSVYDPATGLWFG